MPGSADSFPRLLGTFLLIAGLALIVVTAGTLIGVVAPLVSMAQSIAAGAP